MPAGQARTSKSHPLQIASIALPGKAGAIGITICPGKKDPAAMTGAWHRDLDIDVAAIRSWGAAAVVCLMEDFELHSLGVQALGATVEAAEMGWHHLPIRDVSIPSAAFERSWKIKGAELRKLLAGGGKLLIHCKGGLGRSGVIAARLLVEFGMVPEEAIALVRKYRPGAIENLAQEGYVRKMKPPKMAKAPKAGSPSEDRAVGCLIGLAIGDALGTTLEFSARDSKPPVTDLVGGGPFNLKPGQWTDDTSMALCLAETLLQEGKLEPLVLMEGFRSWREEGHNSVTGHCFDIGITTSQAISRFAVKGDPLAGSADPGSAGNGSIMRLAPVPIFFAGDLSAGDEAAVLQSRTTHAAPECLDACLLMNRILQKLINGVVWEEAVQANHSDIRAGKIRELGAGGWKGKKRSEIKSTGYVVDTLEAALWAVNSTSGFREALVLAVNLGGDADTVGAVTGQLAGARYGFKAMPKDWIKTLAWSTRLVDLARQLSNFSMR